MYQPMLLQPFFLQIASPSTITVLVILVLVLLLLTAITAGAETAFFSLKSKDVNYLKTKEHGNARDVIQLLEQPKLLLATVLVANNTINIAIVIVTNLLVRLLLPEDISAIASFLIQIIAVTFLLVLFGEVLPKVYAVQNNLRMALFSAPVLKVMNNVFRPVSTMLVSSTSFIEEKMGNRPNTDISTEDFEQAIELTVGHTATREEVSIFKGILKFGNITARQIMRTRLDVAAVPYHFSFPEVQQRALETGYSRMPVYKETLDQVAGIIYTKDFLPYADLNEFEWQTLIRPVLFVHESKLIEELLKEFQKKRMHLAIVVDEFGGTSGIITLEDIMEEIIGEIKDEFDEDENLFRRVDDRNYIFEGKVLINDLCRIIGVPADTFNECRGESDSLAGLLLEIAGRFPTVNETLHFHQFEFTVLEIDKMRLRKIKVHISDANDDEED